MNTAPKVSVIILSWNGLDYLKQYLPTVIDTPYANYEVIVADNCSTDNTVSYIHAEYPTVKCIVHKHNLGFAEGYNKAIEQTDSEYIVLLNQDVDTHGDWISPMIQLMEQDPLLGAVQPKIRSIEIPDEFEYAGAAGGCIDKYGYPFCRGRIFNQLEKDINQYNTHAEIFWASGACMMVRKSIYQKSGGLDPDFFAHMEEIDLCWRMKNMGYKIAYCPDALVYHLGGGSLPQGNPKKTFLNFRNNLALLTKNYRLGHLGKLLSIRLLLDIVASGQFILKGDFANAMAVLRAIFAFYNKYPEWKKKRKELASTVHNPNISGYYPHSIIKDFFILKNKTYLSLRLR